LWRFHINSDIFFKGEKENILERKMWYFLSDLLKKLSDFYKVKMDDIFLGKKYELKRINVS